MLKAKACAESLIMKTYLFILKLGKNNLTIKFRNIHGSEALCHHRCCGYAVSADFR